MLLLVIQSSAYLFTLRYAANNGELETLRSSRNDVEELLQELDISGEERSQLFKSIADASIQSGQPYGNCSSSHASYVSSSPSSFPESQSAAIDVVALALYSPTLFYFGPLFKLDAVVSAKDHEAFYDLPYSEVASILQIELNEVEKWAIDALANYSISTSLPFVNAHV
ncbi:hypothetical protein BDR06DRAFT_1021065 [Suillus hirtellus]|nr:hypothetical protein BDR06DRAFT_1021065 [Suillus hirtellus]